MDANKKHQFLVPDMTEHSKDKTTALSVMQRDQRETSLVASHLSNFANYTSAHGFSRLTSASTIPLKVFWCLMLLGTYIGFGIHLSTLIQRYVERPLSTTYNPSATFTFPDIYICSKYPLSISKLIMPIEDVNSFSKFPTPEPYKTHMGMQVNNLTLHPDAANFLTAYNYWSKIITDAYATYGLSTSTCRTSTNGDEYNGTKTIAVRYDLNNMATTNVTCLNWQTAKNRITAGWTGLSNSSQVQLLETLKDSNFVGGTIASNANYCRSLKGATLGTLKKLLGTLSNGGTDNKISNANFFSIRELAGPYCFTDNSLGVAGSLEVETCGIEFCSQPADAPNCNYGNSRSYTGKTSTTRTSKTCLNWEYFLNGSMLKNANSSSESLPKPMQKDLEQLLGYGYKGFIPSGIKESKNYCRQAALLFSKTLFINGTHSSYQWSDITNGVIRSPHTTYNYEKPWCLVEDHNRGSFINAEDCEINYCESGIDTIGRMIMAKTTPQVMDKAFGPDLEVSLLSCLFRGATCTMSDFTNFHHPQMGTCFKFNSEDKLSNLSASEQSQLSLSIKWFADAHDVNGNVNSNESPLLTMTAGMQSVENEQSGLYVAIVPKEKFPFKSHAIEITAGSHTTISYTPETHIQYYTDSDPCIQDSERINASYMIASWIKNTSYMNPFAEYASTYNAYDPKQMVLSYYKTFNETSNIFSYGHDECMNEYIVQAYVDKCSCLPFNFPTPTKYASYPLCYETTSTAEIIDTDICYRQVSSQLGTVETAARIACKKLCTRQTYTHKSTVQNWPDMFYQGMRKSLVTITNSLGFPETASYWKGISGIYYAMLYCDNTTADSTDLSMVENARAMREALRGNLVKLTVSSQSSTGTQVTEDEAYPTKSFFADLGGILGLWSGISVLTICELIELIILVVTLIKLRAAGKVESKELQESKCSTPNSVSRIDVSM